MMWQLKLRDAADEAREEGRTEGRREGRQEGQMEEKIAIARNLLKMNVLIDQIAAATSLTQDEIKQLMT